MVFTPDFDQGDVGYRQMIQLTEIAATGFALPLPVG